MEKYGIDNVRNQCLQIHIIYQKMKRLSQLYCELNNLCRKCGGKGHFINQCDHSLEPWVDNLVENYHLKV